MKKQAVAGTDGDKYIPYENREGQESVVYFTANLSAEGLLRIFDKVGAHLTGKVGIKLHTGEKDGPNIIPRPWVKKLVDERLSSAAIVETNTYYEGDRYTTPQHRETIAVNGWTFCPVDILDEDGIVMLPVNGGKWFTEMAMGGHLPGYDSLLVLTHFKGHTKGGFGGSCKNIGIGCADGRVGKAMIHTTPGSDDMWDISNEEFMERMTESAKAVADHFGKHIVYINVLRNMSVSCDCEGCAAEPVVTPNVGILASTDLLAVDQASVDLIYAMQEHQHADLVERMESRHGLRQLSYMKELGMGNDRYRLLDIENDDSRIWPAAAVRNVVPFQP
ncbi:DUF362 domain-containing protein [Ruthenibacterium lactatiformans]|jgi:uncharacterized Fe-S center protein|uniref:DUF362 domain-containing protein n=1 Tax=Ruthenibacterium lactatiformans TaxID=1550024 RepID=UPI003AB9B9AD